MELDGPGDLLLEPGDDGAGENLSGGRNLGDGDGDSLGERGKGNGGVFCGGCEIASQLHLSSIDKDKDNQRLQGVLSPSIYLHLRSIHLYLLRLLLSDYDDDDYDYNLPSALLPLCVLHIPRAPVSLPPRLSFSTPNKNSTGYEGLT
ncbi:hypothetical protein H101_08022 [Trichophyton interdigitale H6]|nr:hypothetical protein H101_08022 [Trichophyton interdigitale H6]